MRRYKGKYKSVFRVICLLTATLFLTSCSGKPEARQYSARVCADFAVLSELSGSSEVTAPDGMIEVAENGRLVLYANTADASFAVADRLSGQLWYSNPPNAENDELAKGAMRRWLTSQLLVNDVLLDTNTTKTKNSTVSSYNDGGVSVKTVENGFRVTYNFTDEGYTIPIEYTLLDDSLRAEIDFDKIEEKGNEKILSIQLLPYFGAQSSDVDGYMLIGNGSGAVINFNNGKTQNISPYVTQVYGSDAAIVQDMVQSRTEDTALPLYGIQLHEGGAMLAVCERSAACAYTVSSVSGIQTGYNRSCFEFQLRASQNVTIGDTTSTNYREVISYADDMPRGSIAVRYFFLSDSEDGLGGMAEVTRNYLKVNEGMGNSAVEHAPIYLSVLASLRRETSVLGFTVEKNEKLTTIGDALNIVNELNSADVGGIRLIYDGSSVSQLKKQLSSTYDLWNGIGDKKQLIELSENIRKTEGQLYLKLPTVFFSKNGNGYSAHKYGIRSLKGTPVEIPTYTRNTFYPDIDAAYSSVLKTEYAVDLFEKLADNIKSELSGIGLLADRYTSSPYTDYGENGLYRNQAEDMVINTLAQTGGDVPLAAEAPMMSAISYMSDVLSIPNTATDYTLVDYSVPFYQMVLHGSVSYGCRPINSDGDSLRAYLLCIAYGAAPHYELTAKNSGLLKKTNVESYYGSDYSYWKDTIIEQYKEYSGLWNKIGKAVIVDYQIISEELLRTVYSNGCETLVNLSDSDATVDGIAVPANNFILREVM